MGGQLIVVLGAGASSDCVSEEVGTSEGLRPPLVKDLFRGDFETILSNYPLAQSAAAEIRPVTVGGSISLEEYLKEKLVESESEDARRRYRQIPLYFQELLTRVSATDGRGFTRHPDCYDVLVNACLDLLDEVVFVTLNYDTLLDDRFFPHRTPLHSLDAYIEPGRKWSLIKLHGSVNWGRPIEQKAGASTQARRDVINRLFDELDEGDFTNLGEPVLRVDVSNLEEMQYDRNNKTLFYPALSAPLGSADELSCPESHQEFLKDRLRKHNGLNILVIGYSGLDQEFLRLLQESGNRLRTLKIVNGSKDDGERALDKVMSLFPKQRPGHGAVHPSGFQDFAMSGQLRDFVSSVK